MSNIDSYDYAYAIYKYLETDKSIKVESRFMDKDKLEIIEVFHYLSWKFMNKDFGPNVNINTKTIGQFDFKYQTGKKYYEYGGRKHDQGFSENMFISYNLSVKLHDEDDSKYKVLYTSEAICG